MDENEYLVEKLNSIRNEMSHCWGAAFVTGGGVFTLAVTEMNLLKLLFIVLGLPLTILFINAYFLRRRDLFYVLNKLNKEIK